MKKHLLCLAILLVTGLSTSTGLIAQKKNKKSKEEMPAVTEQASVPTSPDQLYELQEKLAENAKKYGDVNVAKSAMHTMLALKPENTFLKDSLAALYFSNREYVSCILLCRELLEVKTDPVILETAAIAERSLGLSEESLKHYQTLFSLSGNLYHLFQIASVQYDAQKLDECKKTLDRLIINPDAATEKIFISANNNQQQEVPIKAASENMYGVIFMTEKNLPEAKRYFNQSLTTSPEFELAKSNLELLNKKK